MYSFGKHLYMWLTTMALGYCPTILNAIQNNLFTKLQILTAWLLIFSTILFILQKVTFARFFDTKPTDKKPQHDLYYTTIQMVIIVTIPLIFMSSTRSGHIILELPLDFSPILGLNTKLSLLIDNNSTRFLATTIFIGFMVNPLIPVYMGGEVCIQRFWNLLNAFLFSMAYLICSGNYLTLMLFWELIGFFSYFLINFWKKKASTLKSAMKAFVYNSVSDICLIVFIVLYFKNYGTLNFPTEATTILLNDNILGSNYPLYTGGLLVAASCKSAQFFFHFWLPDSMDAPAPASALIHSATLVAAGVFLIMRSKDLVNFSPNTKFIMILSATLTICIGGLSATYQSDLKKILAYSTISNCGFMIFITITNSNLNSFLFFLTHGVFKAASFVLVGFLIVKMAHKQDRRFSGNLISIDGFMAMGLTLMVGSLGGLPLTTMHYIKHHGLSTNFNSFNLENFTTLCITIGILTSTSYAIKIITTVIIGNFNKTKYNPNLDSENVLHSKLATVTNITFVTYLTASLFIFFIKNKEFCEFINIPEINIWHFEEMNFGIITNSDTFNKIQHYSLYSTKAQQMLFMGYVSTILLISLPTWIAILQKNIVMFALSLPIVLLSSIIL